MNVFKELDVLLDNKRFEKKKQKPISKSEVNRWIKTVANKLKLIPKCVEIVVKKYGYIKIKDDDDDDEKYENDDEKYENDDENIKDYDYSELCFRAPQDSLVIKIMELV